MADRHRGRSTVGIFSRSWDGDYAWLQDQLQDHCEVVSVYISNDNRYKLIPEIHRCQFAILYHTKHRGRINITDVTDSLYDEEIKLLSDTLGRDRVIVVIDDLEDSSSLTKERILSSQPTLRTTTRDVFLFTGAEKKNPGILRTKLQAIVVLIAREGDPVRVKNTPPARTPTQRTRPGAADVGSLERVAQFLVLAPLSVAIFYRTYHAPSNTNVFLSLQWVLVLLWKFSHAGRRHLLPFGSGVHSALCWTMAVIISYHTYYRLNDMTVPLFACWVTATLGRRLLGYHRNRGVLMTLLCRAIGYGVVACSFYYGWNMDRARKLPGQIFQVALLSPAILAAHDRIMA